jgi:hypothetical protein
MEAQCGTKTDFSGMKQFWGEPKEKKREELIKLYALIRAVLNTVDRDIVSSLCQYGLGDVWEWGDSVVGNCWRTTGDITDTWGSMAGIGFNQAGHEQFSTVTGWKPDATGLFRLGISELEDRFGAVPDPEFFIDVSQVGANGVHAQSQPVGGFFVEQPFRHQVQDFLLARGKARVGFHAGDLRLNGRHGLVTIKEFDQAPGNRRAHGRTAAMHFADGVEDLVWRRVLEEIPGGAGGKRGEDPVVIFQRRQHDDFRVRQPAPQGADGGDPVEPGQLNIHQEDVRRAQGQTAHGGLRIGINSAAGKPW